LAGYQVPPFNDEPYAHHWFEKRPPHSKSANLTRAPAHR